MAGDGWWVRPAFFELLERVMEGALGAGFVAAEVVESVSADDKDPSEIAVTGVGRPAILEDVRCK